MSQDDESVEYEFPELTPFEASLAALAPRTAGLDREELFFRAGHAATLRDLGERRLSWTRWAWPAAFSAMTVIAATLLAMLCLRGAKRNSVGRRDRPRDCRGTGNTLRFAGR